MNVAVNTSVWHSIFSAGLVVQMTLMALVVMSLYCWAIILQKRKQFRLIEQADDDFLDLFWKANSLDEVFEKVDKFGASPVAQCFKAGFKELQRLAESDLAEKIHASGAEHSPKLGGLDNITRALRKSTDMEIASFENRLNVLATTGSTGPFIGLFGTVWGIMSAFQKIGATGSANLAVVAPGISEALITTAIGLVTAIPAVVAYNHFITKIKKRELEISNFSSDFLNIVKRNFFKEK
jgi:biopolymer transport protein TolQ